MAFRVSEVKRLGSGNPPTPVPRAAGKELEATTRSFMESRFHHDFSRVRVHADSEAAESANTVNAFAYTVGTDIFFARDRYAPRSLAGKRLLAHELAHVVQQVSGRAGAGTSTEGPEAQFSVSTRSTPGTALRQTDSDYWPDSLPIGERPTTDNEIEALGLTATAKTGAEELKKKHPAIRFTSGLRTVAEQASAMATNIVLTKNRNWIRDVPYVHAAALQKWVDDNPKAVTKAQIAAGLEATMNALSETDRAKVSKHLTGQAFDVQPQTKDAAAIKADMNALSGLSGFKEKEGGLVRWHAQFKTAGRAASETESLEREADRAAEDITL